TGQGGWARWRGAPRTGRGLAVAAGLAGQSVRESESRKWRGKRLKRLDSDSEMAPRSPEVALAAQPGRRGFRGEIPLGRTQHLEPDHEFPDRRRAQERRVEMGVHLPLGVQRPVDRLLM